MLLDDSTSFQLLSFYKRVLYLQRVCGDFPLSSVTTSRCVFKLIERHNYCVYVKSPSAALQGVIPQV